MLRPSLLHGFADLPYRNRPIAFVPRLGPAFATMYSLSVATVKVW